MANELLQTHAIIAKCITVEMSEDFPATTYQLLGEIIEIADISETREQIDVTPFSCAATDDKWLYRKEIDGMYNAIVVSMVLNYPDSRDTFSYYDFEDLNTLRISGATRAFEIVYPDAKSFSFEGRIVELINRVSLDAQITFEIQVRLEIPILYV